MSGAYDMAILVMHAKIRFSPNVKPICLPTQDIQDEDREAFTAGYGLRYVSEKKEDAVLANELQSSCLTNEIGPSTFNHCQGVSSSSSWNTLFIVATNPPPHLFLFFFWHFKCLDLGERSDTSF